MPTTLLLAVCGGLVSRAEAQFSFYESFQYSTAPGWAFTSANGTGPYLTAGSALGDAEGEGWLRLTSLENNQANAVFLNTKIPSSNNRIEVTFDLAMYDGSGADGFTFFLYDAAVEDFSPGAYGGSLGYANRSGVGGMPGGYVGISFDNYGNVANNGEGRNGGLNEEYGQGSGTLYPNTITVRGPDTGALGGQDGYEFLASTGSDSAPGVNYTILDENGNPTSVDPLTQQLDFPTYQLDEEGRPLGADLRSARMVIDENDILTVYLRYGEDGDFVEVMKVGLADLGVERPEELRLGFAGSTGGSIQVIEMRRIDVETTAAVGTWFWDNGQGRDQKYWGETDGAPAPGHQENWKPNSNPGTGLAEGQTANVVFNNQYVNEDQHITVQDGDKTVNSMTFGGQYQYVLDPDTGENSLTIIFDQGDSDQSASYINVLNNAQGNADHEINVNLKLANELQVDHYVDQTLTFGGDIDTQGNVMDVETSGRVVISGRFKSNDELRKNGTGTLVLQGDNRDFTGDLIVNRGTAVARTETALGVNGSGNTVDVQVADGATLAFDALNGTEVYRPQSITVEGTGVGDAGALQALAGRNTVSSATQITVRDDLTVGASEGATLALDAGLQGVNNGNNIDLVKVGAGTVELNGSSNYRGTTTLRDGTLSIGTNAMRDQDGAMGHSGSEVQIGDSGTDADGNLALLTNRSGVNIGRNLSVNDYGDTTTLGGTHTSGTSYFSGNINLDKDVILTAADGGTVSFTGSVNGNRTATKVGAGTVSMDGNASISVYDIQEGRLNIGRTNALDGNPDVILADREGAIFSLGTSNANAMIRSLQGGGTQGGDVYLGNNTLQLYNGAVSNYAGTISGTGNIRTGDSHSLTLTGTNTYTGATYLGDNSYLYLANQNGPSIAHSSQIVTANHTLVELGASDQIGESTDFIFNGGTFATGGYSDALGDFGVTRSSTFLFNGDSSLMEFDGYNGSSNGTLSVLDWDGDAFEGGGADQFLVTQDLRNQSNLLNRISFSDWGDATAGVIDRGNGLFEIVPTFSESYTWDGGSSATGVTANDWLQKTTEAYSVYFPWWDYTYHYTVSTYENWVDDPTYAPQGVGSAIYMPDEDGSFDNWTVDPHGSVTLGYWFFAGQDDYTLLQSTDNGDGASNLIVLDTSSGPARISMNGTGDRTLATRLRLNDDLIWSNNGTGAVLKNGGDLELNGQDATFRGSGDITISAQITGSNSSDLTKEGSSTLVLSGSNSYGGTTTVTDGTLEARDANALGNTDSTTTTVVLDGGTLGLRDTGTISNESLTLAGGGFDGQGALRNVAGNNRWNQDISLSADATVTTAGGTLTLGDTGTRRSLALGGHTLTLDGAGTTDIYAQTSGSGNLVKNGTGTARLLNGRGTDTVYTGTTTVNAGTLELSLSTSNNVDLEGDVTVGDGVGTDTLRTLAQNQIDNDAQVRVNTSGVLELGGNGSYTEEIGDLILEGGAYIHPGSGSGTRTLRTGGDVTRVETGDDQATIATNVDLDGRTVDFDVADNPNALIELEVSGVLSNGGIHKTGGGVLHLSNANTYAGTTTISEGAILASNNRSLGSSSRGTVVESGASLALAGLNGNLNISDEALTLNGTGVNGIGALYNDDGSNTWGGSVTLASDAGIGAEAGSKLSITHGIDGDGGLIKLGAGEVDLRADNTFAGDVSVQAGRLTLSASDAIGDKANVDFADRAGAELVLDGRDETLGSISGGGRTGGNILLGDHTLSVGENNADTTYNGSISGNGDLVKTGSGRLTLTGQNTLSGEVDVNEGTLRLSSGVGNAIDGASQINIDGGTLLLYDHNQVSDQTAVAITSGGSLKTDGHSDAMGTLELAGAGTLDLGEGSSILSFTDSSSLSWTTDGVLVVENWSGERSGGGIDQIYFGDNADGLTSDQVTRIIFKNPNGFKEGYYGALLLENGELVPVPEPATIIGASALLALIGGHSYRRRKKKAQAEA